MFILDLQAQWRSRRNVIFELAILFFLVIFNNIQLYFDDLKYILVLNTAFLGCLILNFPKNLIKLYLLIVYESSYS